MSAQTRIRLQVPMVLVTLDSAKSLTAATKDRVSSIVCDKNQTAALEFEFIPTCWTTKALFVTFHVFHFVGFEWNWLTVNTFSVVWDVMSHWPSCRVRWEVTQEEGLRQRSLHEAWTFGRHPCFCLTILTQPSSEPLSHRLQDFARGLDSWHLLLRRSSVAYCSLCFLAQVRGCSVPYFQQRPGVRMNAPGIAPKCRAGRSALHCWAGRSEWRG